MEDTEDKLSCLQSQCHPFLTRHPPSLSSSWYVDTAWPWKTWTTESCSLEHVFSVDSTKHGQGWRVLVCVQVLVCEHCGDTHVKLGHTSLFHQELWQSWRHALIDMLFLTVKLYLAVRVDATRGTRGQLDLTNAVRRVSWDARSRFREDEGRGREICHLVSQSGRGIPLFHSLLCNVAKATGSWVKQRQRG